MRMLRSRGRFQIAALALAWVCVLPAPGVEIAHLHTLLDPVTFLPADTTTIFTVEGVVTTHANLADPPSTLFYIQDASAGIAVFHQGGAAAYSPQAGDRVRVTAPLAHFNGLLELQPRAANAEHAVTLLDRGNPRPEPLPFDFSWRKDPNVIEPFESRYVVLRDVLLDLSASAFKLGGENVAVTNAATGETATLRIDARTDIPGQTRPAVPVTIFGVLSQFDSSSPRTSGYQIVPTRFADIVAEIKAPAIRFTNVLETVRRPGDVLTNTFEELVLLPGETLRIDVAIDDPEGREVRALPDDLLLPADASWNFDSTTAQAIRGAFRFTPAESLAGRFFAIRLRAANAVAASEAVWTIHVPSAAEQGVVMTEILANPTSNADAPHYNPLRRAEPAPNPASHDEYVELVNFGSFAVDVAGWTISDEVQVRHRFENSYSLPPAGSLVIFGGPWTGHTPGLSTPFLATSVAQLFGLNNSGGDTLSLRNAQGRLLWRVRYTSLPNDGSLTRTNRDSAFVSHADVSSLPVSPGVQPDGRPFGEAQEPAPHPELRVDIAQAGVLVRLSWNSVPGRGYSVLRFGATGEPPAEVAALTATQAATEYETAIDETLAFYLVRAN